VSQARLLPDPGSARYSPAAGAAGVLGLACVPGDEDPLVADGEQASEPERGGARLMSWVQLSWRRPSS
jgi:hypothetical protein